MAVAVSPADDARPPTRSERKLAWLLRVLGLLFVAAAIGFLLRPDGTVVGLDRVGALAGLPMLTATSRPMASDFWLSFAVANMATLAACAWLAAGDVRRRRPLVHVIVVSALALAGTAALLFVRWAHAFSFLAAALVGLTIAIVLISALRDPR
jgi:hypothetical protein